MSHKTTSLSLLERNRVRSVFLEIILKFIQKYVNMLSKDFPDYWKLRKEDGYEFENWCY